jgi:hypothetical protein
LGASVRRTNGGPLALAAPVGKGKDGDAQKERRLLRLEEWFF